MKWQAIFISLWIIIAVLFGNITALASDVSDAEYVATIRVTNNSTDTSASNVWLPFTLSTQGLSNLLYISANASNTSLKNNAGTDVAYMPAPGSTTDWVVHVPSVNASTNLDYLLYLGGATDMAGRIRWFPGSGGMTTSDNSSLEIGNNSTIELKGYIDTTVVGANVTDKQDALRTYVSASGNVTSVVAGWTLPAGFSDPDTAWTSENNAYDNNTATYAVNANIGDNAWGSYLILNTFAAVSDSVRYFASGSTANITQIDIDVYSGSAWQDVYQGTFTQSTWETKTFTLRLVTQVRVRLYNNTVGNLDGRLHEVQIGEPVAVTATGISSGNTTILTTLGTTTRDLAQFTQSVTSYMSAGAIYNSQSKFWASMWIKPSQNYQAGGNMAWLLTKYNGNPDRIQVYYNDSGRLTLRLVAGGADFSLNSAAMSLTSGTWYHVFFSINQEIAGGAASDGARLLVNGVATTNAGAGTMPTAGSFELGFQSLGGELATAAFNGIIADVIVGTDDLTGAEETALYNGTAPGDETDLWALDEGTGTSITSYGSSANTGTLQASNTWTTASAPHAFSISVGGVWKAGKSLRGQSVPNNAYSWIVGQGIPYIEYYKIWVNGALKQHIIWQNDDTTFLNQADSINHATPTFRTTSSNANVSASVISLVPVLQAQAPNFTLGTAGQLVTEVPGQPAGLYIPTNEISLPGATFINILLNKAGVPESFFWYIITTLIVLALGHYTYKAAPSLFIKALVMGSAMFFFALTNVYGIWVTIFFGMKAFAVIILSKHFSWG